MRGRSIGKRGTALALGGLLVVLVVVLALTTGGGDSVTEDSVAVVDGQQISQEEFQNALAQTAKRQGLDEPPKPDNPQYEGLRDQAMTDLLDLYWIEGEAADRGIEVSDRQVEDRLQQIKKQQFKGSQAKYAKFLADSGYTEQDVIRRVRLQLLAQQIQNEVNQDGGDVSLDEARKYYDANIESFGQPASRDVRFIENEDERKVAAAIQTLEADDSPKGWQEAASRYSTGPEAKDGGLRKDVVDGSLPNPLGKDVFDAEVGSLGGPVKSQGTYYAYQVVEETEAKTQPFDQVSAQIQQQLAAQVQQEAFADFLTDYQDRWASLTICADGFLFERCRNFVVVGEECTPQQAKQSGCPAPVPENRPVQPGTVAPFIQAQGKPQGPQGSAPSTGGAPTIPGLPGGAVPGG